MRVTSTPAAGTPLENSSVISTITVSLCVRDERYILQLNHSRTGGYHCQQQRQQWCWEGAGRRAPKLTVTRKGDTLCQKGCYPMAVCFCVGFFSFGSSLSVR